MIEYCSSMHNKNTSQFSGHFLSDFAVLCSCIISHPLYLSYFLFFSPYLLKLLSFLSPLFITTTLLLLSLLHGSFTFSTLLEDLQQLRFGSIGGGVEESNELEGFEEFEVYKIVFGDDVRNGAASGYGSGHNKVQWTNDWGSCRYESFHISTEQDNPVEFSREIRNPGEEEEEEEEEKVLGVLICDDGGFQAKCQNSIVEFSREIRNPGEEEEEEEEKVLGVLICESQIKTVEFPGKIEDDLVEENPSEEEKEKILGVLLSDDVFFRAKGEEESDEFAVERQDDERMDELSAQETSKCEKVTNGVAKAGEKTPKMADKKHEEVPTPSCIDGGSHTEKKALIKARSRRRGEGVWSANDGNNSISKKSDDYYSYSSSRSQPISPSLSNVGSMRKEKEWRRTLACKLFEERHNAGGDGGGGGGAEGMDMLWEAYEKTEENRGKQSGCLKKKEKEKKIRKGRVADYEDEDDDDGGEEVENVKLCCLQALKFSAGKMNFGMGRPGFMKISKAFKGIGGGWLSHHSSHQHSGGGSKKGKSS